MSQKNVKTYDHDSGHHHNTMKQNNPIQNQLQKTLKGNFPLDIRASIETVERMLSFDVGDHAKSIQDVSQFRPSKVEKII